MSTKNLSNVQLPNSELILQQINLLKQITSEIDLNRAGYTKKLSELVRFSHVWDDFFDLNIPHNLIKKIQILDINLQEREYINIHEQFYSLIDILNIEMDSDKKWQNISTSLDIFIKQIKYDDQKIFFYRSLLMMVDSSITFRLPRGEILHLINMIRSTASLPFYYTLSDVFKSWNDLIKIELISDIISPLTQSMGTTTEEHKFLKKNQRNIEKYIKKRIQEFLKSLNEYRSDKKFDQILGKLKPFLKQFSGSLLVIDPNIYKDLTDKI